MLHAFQTQKGSVDDVEIAGVGLLGANAVGGKLVIDAAKQLQELMDVSAVSVENPRGVPLEGDALKAAAEKFAEDRDLQVVEVQENEIAGLNVGIGALGDFTPAIEVAQGEARRIYGDSTVEAEEIPGAPEEPEEEWAGASSPAHDEDGMSPLSPSATP